MDRTDQIPVFPNVFPYNELLMTGQLLAKTRSWVFKYRGPILLYTSGRNESIICESYGLDPKLFPHSMVVGRANLVDVRPITMAERKIITRQFNPGATKRQISDYLKYGLLDFEMIGALDIGFFFEDIERLPQPVKIKWPRGAVTLCYLPISEAEPLLARNT